MTALTITIKSMFNFVDCFAVAVSTTTPLCEITDGMDSPTTIPSSELSVSDKTADVEKLRPSSPTTFESYAPTLTIEYTPSGAKPVKDVTLVSLDNIKSYTVEFLNADDTVTRRLVGLASNKMSLFYKIHAVNGAHFLIHFL